MRPASLADVAEHRGGVQRGAQEGVGTGAEPTGGVVCAQGRRVVMLKDGPLQHERPPRRPHPGAQRVGVRAPMDGTPRVLRFVVGLGVWGDGDNHDPGASGAPGGESRDDEIVAVALASHLGSEVATKGVEAHSG